MNVQSLTMKDVMTPSPVTVGIDQTAEFALNLMNEYEIRHLPVLEDEKLAGIISDRSINLAISLLKIPSSEILVREVYVKDPYCADLKDPLHKVLKDMAAYHIGSALVMNSGTLAGIFTTVDACAVFGELLLSEGGGAS